MANPVNSRPQTAPTMNLHEKEEFDDPTKYERCTLCFKRIFGGSFADIGDINPQKKKSPICSFSCFQKYIASQPMEPPNIQNMTLPSVKAKPSIVTPKVPMPNPNTKTNK